MNSPNTINTTNTGWNVEEVYLELEMAFVDLSRNHLKQAAKFIAEQLHAMNYTPTTTTSSSATAPDSNRESSEMCYARSLFELGEFQRAAHILTNPTTDGPKSNLSCAAINLRARALYLTGERQNNESVDSNQQLFNTSSNTNNNDNTANKSNKYVPQLVSELCVLYEADELDAFGIYMYSIVLNIKNNQIKMQHNYLDVLLESILAYPLNWSAWMDLLSFIKSADSNNNYLIMIESRLDSLKEHYMWFFFLTQHFLEQEEHYLAKARIDDLLNLFPNSLHLSNQQAMVYYDQRDYEEAAKYFESLRKEDPYGLDYMDRYANVLYVTNRQKELSHLAHTMVQIDKYRPETCCVVASYYSMKARHEKAVMYFQRALKLDRSFLSAWTLMGHEFMEMKNTAAAIESYRRAVDIDQRDYRAWYGLGQTYELLNSLLFALYYYKKAASLRPYDFRLWNAMGECYKALGKRSEAIKCYERARENNDTEGLSVEKLGALYRDESKFEKAAICYEAFIHMRLDPHGIAEDGVMIEENVAEALLFLGQFYKTQRKYEKAESFCSRLLDYTGPEKEEAKALLRELTSLKDQNMM